MRKYFMVLALLVLFYSNGHAADGQIGATRTCPANQTCAAGDGQIGATNNADGQIGATVSATQEDSDDQGITIERIIESLDIFGIGAFISGL